MFDGFPSAFAAGVSLPFDFILDVLGIAYAFADDPFDFVKIGHILFVTKWRSMFKGRAVYSFVYD